jgi:hypothetical protein
MAYDERHYEAVRALLGTGLSDYAIARRTGVKRGTVRNWRIAAAPPAAIPRRRLARSWSISDEAVCSYLLGIYLGDGTVCALGSSTPWLQVVNDRAYPDISQEIMAAMENTFRGAPARTFPSSVGESDVLVIRHPAVLRAFPQHGPGRKHLRTIELVDWQRELTHRHPGALVRGLIHSDGCRTENRFKTKLPSGRIAEYHYTRYFFSNHSADIHAIFSEHCDLLGVRVTQSNPRNLSISHRASVTILESLVGPKT